MGLFPIFGADPEELEDAQGEAETYERKYEVEKSEKLNAKRKKREQKRLAEHESSALDQVANELSKVPDVTDTVETLDQPRVAYKSVDTGVATLLIPEGATVVHPYTSTPDLLKRRTDEAIVLKIETVSEYDIHGHAYNNDEQDVVRGESDTSGNVTYAVGTTVTPSDGDPHAGVDRSLDMNTSRECVGGIHFFRNKGAAKDWHNWHKVHN
jgi:hypothetical protein